MKNFNGDEMWIDEFNMHTYQEVSVCMYTPKPKKLFDLKLKFSGRSHGRYKIF